MDIAAVHHFVGAVCTFLKRVRLAVEKSKCYTNSEGTPVTVHGWSLR